MRITSDRSQLATALGVAARAVTNRNTLPILSYLLIETEDAAIRITGTDLDTSIRVHVPAQVSESGAVALPASLLAEMVSKLPDAPVTLEVQDGKTAVRCGKSHYTVLALPAEDYPVVPEVPPGPEVKLPQPMLKHMLHMTTFAASKEESRSLLMGVLFEVRGSNLFAVATDTHRLAWTQVSLGEETPPVSAVVPARPLIELERVLKDSSDEGVIMRLGNSQVQFQTPTVTLVSRVLDGQFPNYQKVIPKNLERTLTFDRMEMLNAVRRVYTVARSDVEKAILSTKGAVMELTAESPDIGRAYEEVPIAMDGDDITIAFNARYLIEVLGLIDVDRITLELSGALNPGILRPAGTEDYIYVVMPMAV